MLDNTYMSRASRALVVQAATQLGLPVRCVWLSTSVEDAQVNAVSRIVANYGRLLGPDEMKQAVKRDISAFAPSRAVPPSARARASRSRGRILANRDVPFERTRDRR